MSIPKTAVAFGVTMGAYAIWSVYLVVEYLPPSFGWLIPAGGLAIAVAVFWPGWFDGRPPVRLGRRVLRRLAAVGVAVPVGALTAFLMVLAAPWYTTWGDNLHRAALVRQGKSAAEIETAVAAHHQTPQHFLRDGAFITAIAGVIGGLVSAAAGAVMLRQRPARP